MNQMMTGALAMGFAVAALFFLRFWRETGDRLFALFSLTFCVLAITRMARAFTSWPDDHGDYLYWIRLAAFGLILLAILDKNRKPRRSRESL